MPWFKWPPFSLCYYGLTGQAVCARLLQLISTGFSLVSVVTGMLAGWWLRDLGWSYPHVWMWTGCWPGIGQLSAGLLWFCSVGALPFLQANSQGCPQDSSGLSCQRRQDKSYKSSEAYVWMSYILVIKFPYWWNMLCCQEFVVTCN